MRSEVDCEMSTCFTTSTAFERVSTCVAFCSLLLLGSYIYAFGWASSLIWHIFRRHLPKSSTSAYKEDNSSNQEPSIDKTYLAIHQ